MDKATQDDLTKLHQQIAGVRELLADQPDLLEAALAPLLTQRAKLEAELKASGQIIQDSIQAGGDQAVVGSVAQRDIIGGKENTIIYAEGGSTVVIGEAPVDLSAVEAESDLGHYLRHLISRNRYLQLQGIRSGGKLVHIELDRIYITLRTTGQPTADQEMAWLQTESLFAPGERSRIGFRGKPDRETRSLSINEALTDFNRLVVLGDPGSGKTTLMRYLALLYATDMAQEDDRVQRDLGLSEQGYLPVLLYLRQIGAFLQKRNPIDDGTVGAGLLLEYLTESLRGDRLNLPATFFDSHLASGQVVMLLDGLDEVADPTLRRRVSRLVEAFCQAYPDCRYVVTSRIVGYVGGARLSEKFATTTVRHFTMRDVETFLASWYRLVAAGQMGPGPSADAYAREQTRQLKEAIAANDRIRDLAINPLLLTVIAMVHRDRVKLPDRRAELYAEAIDVLLGKWDEARGVEEMPILEGDVFDTGDKRLMLQELALHMHLGQQKEIMAAELRTWLGERFYEIVGDWRKTERAVNRFIEVIEARTGLLLARGEGVYSFSHLTFQEYLAALAIAGRDDYITYTLSLLADNWWNEVIQLEAGYLSTQSLTKTTSLIAAIADYETEPEPFHNLVLAAECILDVGGKRVRGGLEQTIQNRLQADINLDLGAELARMKPGSVWENAVRRIRREGAFDETAVIKNLIERKAVAAQALARSGVGHWSRPYGEPDWVEIPAGSFWLGGTEDREFIVEKGTEIPLSHERTITLEQDEQAIIPETPQHQLWLEQFYISRTLITNAQYHRFVAATGYKAPRHWEDERPPAGLESHPVVYVSWHDCLAYCRWLSDVTGKPITLPGEAQWEKAARGSADKRIYPWGDEFEATRCNSYDLGLKQTTPVGIFPPGASPYGVLDMAGNVWEWTRTLWGKDWRKPDYLYPYNQTDGREDLVAGDEVFRVLRGGAFDVDEDVVRCAVRDWNDPDSQGSDFGFRVVVSPIASAL